MELRDEIVEAIEQCIEEDRAFSRVYIAEQCTRTALRSAIRVMQKMLTMLDKGDAK